MFNILAIRLCLLVHRLNFEKQHVFLKERICYKMVYYTLYLG